MIQALSGWVVAAATTTDEWRLDRAMNALMGVCVTAAGLSMAALALST